MNSRKSTGTAMTRRTSPFQYRFLLLLTVLLPIQHNLAEYPAASLSCYQAFAASDFDATHEHCGFAARNGDIEAQFKLARLHASVLGEGDLKKSVKWLTLAANQGHPEAQYHLGMAYYHGKGFSQDFKLASDWYRNAALEGHVKSQRNLAHMYETGEGVTKDLFKAHLWYLKTAEQEISRGQLKVGLMLLEGQGVEPDTKKAASWIAKSARSGDADAQFVLGQLLINKDPEDAVVWYQKAVRQKHVLAMYNFADYLNRKSATFQDLQHAWRLADSAVKAGHTDSITLIGQIELRMFTYSFEDSRNATEQAYNSGLINKHRH